MSVFGRQSTHERTVSSALLSDLGPGMHPRVSIRGGQFALVDAAGMRYGAPVLLQNTPQGQKLVMLAIIVGSNPKKSRVFYADKYDPDNPGPPDCYSDNGLAPSSNSSTPQARTCAECQWSKWGSDTSVLSGKKTKACNEKKKIAIIVVNDTTGLSYELQIPPATLKNMAIYASKVAAQSPPGESRKADVSDFVTAISFIPGQTGILEFNPFAWIYSAYIDASNTLCVAVDANHKPLVATDQGASVGDRIDEIWDSNELDDLLGLKDTPWTPPALAGPLPGMTGYMEPQAHGGALQRGNVASGPASPYSPPAGAHAQAPTTFVPAAHPHTPPVQQSAPQQQPAAGVPATQRTRKPRAAAGTAPQQEQATFQPATGTITESPSEIPDFLRRGAQSRTAAPASASVSHAPGPAANPPAGNAGAYGMVEAGAPPAGIESALDAAFKLATTRT